MARKHNGMDLFDHHRGTEPLLRPTTWWRLAVFVTINLVGFAVVSAFWQYLSTGQWYGVNAFVQHLFLPLGSAFLGPMPVYMYPWMIPVYGLLIGVSIFIPIIVAILYRMRVVVIFLVLLVLAAQQPLLAMAVAVGCLLASQTPLRSNMPMVAALLGLLPVWVYLLAMGSLTLAGTTDWDYWVSLAPMRRWVMYMPYAVALAVSVVGSSVALSLARLMRFRPGVVWPVLLVLSAAPITLFYIKVGPAELEYAQIVNYVEPTDSIFASRGLEEWIAERPMAWHSDESLREDARASILRRRDRLMRNAEAFLKRHTEGIRSPEVLWVLAQCHSMQLDELAYRNGRLCGTCSYPLPASEATWLRLSKDHPTSPQAALATWHLAELQLRRGEVLGGYKHLLEARTQLTRFLETPVALERFDETFITPDMMPSRAVYAGALQSVRERIWLIDRHDVLNDPAATVALAAWLSVDPNVPVSAVHYRNFAEQYADTALGPYFQIVVAAQQSDPRERAAQLLPWVGAEVPTGTRIAAVWELGLIDPKDAGGLSGYRSPEAYLKEVCGVANNPWAQRAAEQLKWLAFAREVRP